MNFLAPAVCVGAVTALFARVFMKKGPATPGLLVQAVVNFAAAALALLGGLWYFGHDGKMATYTALVLVCSTSQLWMLRGNKRR